MYLYNKLQQTIKENEFLQVSKKLLSRILLELHGLRYFLGIKFKYRLFNKCYIKLQWEKCIDISKEILNNHVKDPDFFRKLSICYFKIAENIQSKFYMLKSLEIRAKDNILNVSQTVEKKVFKGKDNIKTEYDYLGGLKNVGVFKHEFQEKGTVQRFLTKIIPNEYYYRYRSNRELNFYTKLQKKVSQLMQVTPEFLDDFEMGKRGLYFMTFEKITGENVNEGSFEDVIKLSDNIIGAIKYSDVVKLSGKEINISSLMHYSFIHRLIFYLMKKKLKHVVNNRHDLDNWIDKLKYLIIELKTYKKIKPEKHYVLCHRDFHYENILYDRANNKHYIIDWASYGVGIKGYDMARFFQSFGISFQHMKKIYLDKIEDDMEETVFIRRFFTTYNFVILLIERLDKSNIQQKFTECILPAIKYMEELLICKT